MYTLFTFKATCDHYSEVGQIRTGEYVRGKIREIEECTYVKKIGNSIYFISSAMKSKKYLKMYPKNTGTPKATRLF